MMICYNNKLSNDFYLKFGLLQGSVLSPILYCLFINDIYNVIDNLQINDYIFSQPKLLLRK